MPNPTIRRDILLAALAGFKLDKQRIDEQIAEVEAMLGSAGGKYVAEPGAEKSGRKGKRSAAVRKKMAEAQRLRWLKVKGGAKAETAAAPKAKRKLSAAGRKAIIAATKKRWAEKRAADAAKSEPKKKAS